MGLSKGKHRRHRLADVWPSRCTLAWDYALQRHFIVKLHPWAPSHSQDRFWFPHLQNAARACRLPLQVRRQVDEPLGTLFHPRRAAHPLHAAFRTLDAASYADIATVPVDRVVLDLAVGNDQTVLKGTKCKRQLQISSPAIVPVDGVVLDLAVCRRFICQKKRNPLLRKAFAAWYASAGGWLRCRWPTRVGCCTLRRVEARVWKMMISTHCCALQYYGICV